MLAELLERRTVTVEHREAVVLRRQRPLAHGVHGDVDRHRGAAKLLLTVVLGQRRLEGPRLPRSEPDDAVDDCRDHLLAIQLQIPLLAVAAGEHLVAAPHHQRAADDVTCLGGAVDVGELGVAPPRLLDRLVDALVGDLGGLHRHPQRQVVAKVDLRLDGDRGGELQRLVALELAEIELRVADRLHSGLIDGAPVQIGDEVIDGLVADGLPADRTLDHRGRRLAGAEPGNADAPRQTAQRRLDGGLDLVGGRLDLEGNLRGGLALERDGHSGSVGHLSAHVSGLGRARTETSNSDGSPHGILSPARLPIPPSAPGRSNRPAPV